MTCGENMRIEFMYAKSTVKNICTARHQCFTAFCQLSTSNAKLRSHGTEESAITELLSHGNLLTAFVQGPCVVSRILENEIDILG